MGQRTFLRRVFTLLLAFFLVPGMGYAVPLGELGNMDNVSQTSGDNGQVVSSPTDEQLIKEIDALSKEVDQLVQQILQSLSAGVSIPPTPTPPAKYPSGMSTSVYPRLQTGKTAFVTASVLNFRTGPWGTIQGKLPRGKQVKILGFKGNWVRVNIDGKEGFVHGKYLSGNSSGDSTANGSGGTTADSNRSAPGPTTPVKGVAKKILNEARNQLGTTRYQTKTCSYGKLSCAAYVSGVLKDSGAINHNGSVSVNRLRAKLESDGWQTVSINKIQPGDVIVWGPYPGRKHGHVGIIDGKSGGTWQTCDNSSSKRVPTKKPLNYRRPIVKVLRAPGA